MTKEYILQNCAIKCESCKENPSKEVKGGKINGEVGMFFLCEDCIKILKDQRIGDRRR